MSTLILKYLSINEKTKKVFMTGYESNVFPKIAKRFESSFLSLMLKERGRKVLDEYFLEQFKGGMIRGGNSEYSLCGQLFGYDYESLERFRALKKENKGRTFVLVSRMGPYFSKFTRKRGVVTGLLSQAKRLSKAQAMIKAKNFRGSYIEEISK